MNYTSKKKLFFLIHPYKIYHIYTKRNIYYKYALRVPSTKGRQKKKRRTRPNFKDASLETCFMYFSLLKKMQQKVILVTRQYEELLWRIFSSCHNNLLSI